MDAKVVTPFNADAFALNLSNHLDQGYVTQLLQSIKEGFNIGYTGSEQTRESPNLKLALNLPDVVSGYLQKECNLGTMQQFSILEIILSLPLCNNATILLTGNNSHFTALQQCNMLEIFLSLPRYQQIVEYRILKFREHLGKCICRILKF